MSFLDFFKQDINEEEAAKIDAARARPMQPVEQEPVAVPEPAPVAPVQRPEPVAADPLADTARHVADKKQGLTVIDGIAQMFGGKAGSTAGTKADLDNQLGNARADDARRKQELLQKYKDSRNKITDGREDAKFDKGAPLANANRLLLMKKLLPEVPPEQQQDFKAQLESMGSEEMKGLLSTVVGGQTSGRDWQILTRQMPDGSNQYVRVNKTNGEEYPIAGAKGYAPQRIKDVVTGDHAFVSPGAPTAAPIKINSLAEGRMAEGETPADYNRRMDVQVSTAKKQGAVDVKEDEDVRDADAKRIVRQSMKKDFIDLYDAATKESSGLMGTGPVTGRVSSLANKFGVTAGTAADQLMTRTGTDLAAYIKETSGTAASEDEMKRLEALRPSIKDDRALFINKMDAYLDEVDKIVAEKKLKAQGSANTGLQTPPPSGTVKRRTKDGKVAVFDATTKEFIRYEGE